MPNRPARVLQALHVAASLAFVLMCTAACGDTTGSTQFVAVEILPQSPSVMQGSSTTLTVSVERQGGYNGAVILTPSTLPPGVSATSDSIPAGSSTGTIVVTAAADAAPQTGTLIISASAGAARATGAVALLTVAVRGSYSLLVTPDTFYIPEGATDLPTIVRITRADNFNGVVQLAWTSAGGISVPSPAEASRSVATVAGSLRIPAGLPRGDYALQLRGTSPGLPDRVATVLVRVNPSIPFLFLNSPQTVRVLRGTSSTTALRVVRGGGYTGPVTLTAQDVPSGMTATFAPMSGDSVLMTVTTTPGVTPGMHNINVQTNVVGTHAGSAAVTVNVVAPVNIRMVNQLDATGEVGKPLAELPRVQVTDALGAAVQGITVRFVPVGPGTVTGGVVVTDAGGFASPGSWTLGTKAQRYVVMATADGLQQNVMFGAQGVAGPATSLVEFGGNQQTGHAGRTVRQILVRALDAYENPVARQNVTFTAGPESGIVSSLTDPSTANDGIYAAYWQLGQAQTQTVTARLGNLPPVIFTATTIPCGSIAYVIGTTVSGIVDPYVSCEIEPGIYGDVYPFTVAAQHVVAFTGVLNLDGAAYLAEGIGPLVSSSFVMYAVPGQTQYAILPAGIYSLAARTDDFSEGGTYTFSTSTVAIGDLAGCITPATSRGAVIPGTINTLDCGTAAGRNDTYDVYVPAGATAVISATSSTSTMLEVNGVFSAQSTNPTLSFTSQSSRMYKVRIYNPSSAVPSVTYTLTVR